MSHEFIAKNGLIIGSGITQAVNHISNNSALTYDSTSILTEDAIKKSIKYNLSLINAGTVTQPIVTNHGNGLLDIGSCTVHLYDNPYNFGNPELYTIPTLNNLQLSVGVYYYISVNYNSGVPIYDVITDNTIINHSDIINVLQATWENSGAHNETLVFTTGNYGIGLSNKIGHRLIHTERFGYQSGFALSVNGTLNVILTGGVVWYDGHEIILNNTINTSITHYDFYYKSSGTWTSSEENVLNVTQYNDGTNLATLSNNKYAVAWVFRSTVDDHIVIIPGEGNYTLSESQESPCPSMPIFVEKMYFTIGKIITEKNATSITQYISLLKKTPGNASVIEWGSIAGDITQQTDLSLILNNKQNLSSNLTSLSGLTYASTSFVKMTGANTFSLDTNTYTSTTRQIIANSGTGSINGGGDLSADRTLTLVGDSVSPGNNMLYGTNASGVKGWYVQPTGSGGTSSVAWTDLTGNITSSQFATALTDETGNGRVVFSTGATMLNTIISGLTVTTINGSTLGSNAFTSTAYQPLNTSLNSITALTYTSTSFIKMTGANAFSLDTNTYLNSSNNLSDVSNTTTALLNLGGKPYHGILSRPIPGPLPLNITTTTFTLSASTSNVTYYYNGKKVIVTTDKTTTLSGDPGLYFIYFDADTGNILNGDFPGIIFTSNVLIASVFWNGSNYGLVNDERHGYNRNLEWHDWAHNTVGCRYKSGISLTHNGGTGAAATFATTSGEIRDEDIRFTVNASSDFPTVNAGRIFYQSGATTYTFLNTPSTVPFHRGANNRPNVVNATTYALTQLPSAVNRYCNVFVYATTDMHTPIYFVTETMPAATVTAGGYTSTTNARAVSFPNLASYGLGPELKPIYRIVVRADGAVQALIATDDYRLVSSLPMSAGNTSTVASSVSYNPTEPYTQTTVQTAIDQSLVVLALSSRQIISNTGTGSIIGGGDLTTDRTLTLVGDSVNPGNSKYYGTDSGGTKGYYDLPTGSSGGTIGVPTSRQIIANSGVGSIIGGGDLSSDRTLTLVGDSATPGNYKRYGTNSGGTKGYYTIPYTPLQYTLMEDVNNNSVYFYSYIQANASTTAVRSGTASGGLQNQFGCSPIIIPQNGKIIGATFLVKGAAVANGSVTYPCTLRTNLYTVGWTTEGSVLSTIDCIIPNSGTPVGTYSVVDTNGKFEVTGLDINVVSGQPLALKWIALAGGASNITIIRNLIVTLWFVAT